MGNERNPALSGSVALMINFLMAKNSRILTKPLKTGDINHEPTIVPMVDHFKPWVPLATKEKPIVEPTILWVPEMGSFKKVATKSHIALLARAAKQPSINSSS